jgi:regulator of cell morphogenesis and NO signaling
MLDNTKPLAQIVLDHPETAAVFQRLALDFCCHGHLRLDEACASAGYNEIAILRELEAAIEARAKAAADPRSLTTPEIIRHIITEHHGYLRGALPTVVSLAVKVAAVHGLRNPQLYDLSMAVRGLSEALLPHIDEEEALLFPAMQAVAPDRAAIAGMLASMETEHEAVGALLAEVRRAASDYLEPEWACRTYRTLFAELVRLEADTLRHVHLENHVLAPRFGGVS